MIAQTLDISVFREQNRLIAEQNALLMQIAAGQEQRVAGEHTTGRMMTDHDLQLILMSDNILAAIDRWNASRPKRR
jgi:hypothetical protein